MSLNALPQAQLILEDHEGYIGWGKAVFQKALQLNLVHELNTNMEYFPENNTVLLEFETTFWDKATSEYARREIKDRGFFRPKPLPANIDVPFADTLAGAEILEEEKERVAYRRKGNIYTANQTLMKETHATTLKAYEDEYRVAFITNMAYLKGIARSKLYAHIVQTLGGYFESSIKQVGCGDATALLNEIDRFMATDPQGKKANLIISFNASTFAKEGCNDIQKWIHYNEQTFNKLNALGEVQSLETRMAVFKKSLPKEIFGQFLVAIFDKPDLTWEALLALAKSYAEVPLIRKMLMAKSSIHSMKSSNLNPSAGIFGVEGKERERSAETCRGFSKGTCRFGAKCNYSHDGVPPSRPPSRPSAPTHGQKCSHCEGFHNLAGSI